MEKDQRGTDLALFSHPVLPKKMQFVTKQEKELHVSEYQWRWKVFLPCVSISKNNVVYVKVVRIVPIV